MSDGEDGYEQLVHFFAYSLFIYPITNWLVSPHRTYPRWKGALYAAIFLLGITVAQMVYENAEAGPNHYQLLNVSRYSNINAIKKSYRSANLIM